MGIVSCGRQATKCESSRGTSRVFLGNAPTVRVVARVRPGNQAGITRELNYRLKVAFDAAGIDIPFPQRVIHSAETTGNRQ